MLRALGGPGPSTLLFRQLIAPSAPTASRHASKSVKVGHDGHVSKKWPRPPKPINRRDTTDHNVDHDTAKSKSKETKARKPPKERSPTTSKGPPPRSKPSKSKQRPQHGTGHTEPNSASAPRPPIPSDVILLPPPLNHSDVTFQVTRLREATASGNFGHVLDVWAHLLDLQAMRAVPAHAFASISELLVKAIHNERNVGQWVFEVPELYDRVRHLAVEAAANDQFEGLFELCLELIKVRPADIVPIFADYKTRFRVVHGLNVEDLVSLKREERVAARIGGKGILPLSLVTIAAHTVLESLDSTAIFSFTDTTADLRGSTMLRAYHAPIQRRMDRKLHTKFYQNIDKVRLAILCFHSAALKARISGYASIRDGKSIRELYDQIMDATKGPDRFIVPVHGFSMSSYYDVVPFSDAMWATFISAFTKVNDQRSIMGLVNHDYPTRAGEPPPLILAHAMKNLSKIQARVRHFTPQERQEMVAQADKLWDQLVDMGADSQASIVRYRIEALWRMGRYKECEDTYTTYRAHLYKVGAPDTELMLCWAFLPYLYRTKQVARAVEMIRGYRSTDPILESYMLSNHIGHILDSGMTHAGKRKLLVEILRSKHRDVVIKPMAWGEVLSFLLNGGQSVESACSTVMQSMDKTGNYTMDIHQLLKGLHEFHWEVTPKTIEASVYILENLGTDFLGLASYDIYVWGFAMETIADVDSRIAPASVRHELIQRVVACSRLDPVNSLAPMERLAMRAHFGRPDGEGVPAALYWYDKIEALGKLVSFDCRLAIESLVKFGYPEKAREIVDVVPKNKPWFKHVSRLAAKLGLKDDTAPTASSVPKLRTRPDDEDIDTLADSDALAAEYVLEAAENMEVDGDSEDVVEEYGRDGERP